MALQYFTHLHELGEDQGLFAHGQDFLQHFGQPGQLAERPGMLELSPRKWAGWLQTCFSLAQMARMTPLAF